MDAVCADLMGIAVDEVAMLRLARQEGLGETRLARIRGLVRVRDREELFREACRIAVEAGGSLLLVAVVAAVAITSQGVPKRQGGRYE